MGAVIIANFVVFTFLALVWGMKDWVNFALKFVFLSLMIFNGVVLFQHFGFIVKV